MNCKRCGTQLLDTDTFCVCCGLKVDEPMVCPSCMERLRDGTRFCHKCGTQVFQGLTWQMPQDEEMLIKKELTTDIPFEAIEQGILMEAEQAVKKREVVETAMRAADTASVVRNQNVPSQRNYIENVYEASTDGDYDDDAEESSVLKKITAILGILIVLIVLGVGVWFWKTNSTETEHEEQEMQEETEVVEDVIMSENGLTLQGRIQILDNVNIRDYPDKDNSKVLFVAKPGETYQYFELVDDAWYHIWLDDESEGYVYKDYVENLSE